MGTELVEKRFKLFMHYTSSGTDCTVAEHILYACPTLVIPLKLRFSLLILHSYVPDSVPVQLFLFPKDKGGDLSSFDNYRPITLSDIKTILTVFV